MELSNISWYAEAFRVPYTGTKGLRPAPGKQPHTIFPSTKLYTLHNAVKQVPFSWQPPNPDLSIWRNVIWHSRVNVSTTLESSGGVLCTTASNTLHCTSLCIAWMQLVKIPQMYIRAERYIVIVSISRYEHSRYSYKKSNDINDMAGTAGADAAAARSVDLRPYSCRLLCFDPLIL